MSAKFRIVELSDGTHRLEIRHTRRAWPLGLRTTSSWFRQGTYASHEAAEKRMKELVVEETPRLVQSVKDYDERGQRTNLGW